MADEGSSRRTHKRRSASRKVNYNEVDIADEFDSPLEEVKEVVKSEDVELPKKRIRTSTRRSLNDGSDEEPMENSRSLFETLKFSKFISDRQVAWNLIPKLPPSFRKNSRFSNVLDLEDAFVDIMRQVLFSDENEILKKDEKIYSVSEPPGEPYYIGRVVKFVPRSEFQEIISASKSITTVFPAKYFQMQLNWYYRPRDVKETKLVFDSRLVYASLHMDLCPISSYRGKCTVIHKSEIKDFYTNEEGLITKSNVFYYDQFFDRYSRKYFKVYSTEKLLHDLNNSSPYLYALNKRFKYIYCEPKYPLVKVVQKYILGTPVMDDGEINWDACCQLCKAWCKQTHSIRCDGCQVPIHIYCMDPPLDRKPNKGVIWVCYNCVQKQEGTPESLEKWNYEQKVEKLYVEKLVSHLTFVANEICKKPVEYNQENIWYQYFGDQYIPYFDQIFSEDVLIPYPFKTSRFGIRFQWLGCGDNKEWQARPYRKDTITDNFSNRGTEDTATLSWKFDSSKIDENTLQRYISRCQESIPQQLGIAASNASFIDSILKILLDCNYDVELAFFQSSTIITKETLQEPSLSMEDTQKFEEAVKEFGGELRPVMKHVGTQPMSAIVKFFYRWKKTEKGLQVRRKKDKKTKLLLAQRHENAAHETKEALKLINESLSKDPELKFIDDSSFDTEKLALTSTMFKCMFCKIDYSPLWYKVTGGSDDDDHKMKLQYGVNEIKHTSQVDGRLGALCIRCARLWRRYGVRWNPAPDVFKKMAGTSNAVFRSLIENTINESNANILISSPSQAHQKFVEWELIQDAELVIRQRYQTFKNSKMLAQMKKYSMGFHALLYKKIVKKIYPYESDIRVLHYRLREYIDSKASLSLENVHRIADEATNGYHNNLVSEEDASLHEQLPAPDNTMTSPTLIEYSLANSDTATETK